MTIFEILLAILVAVNALAFMYFMYVDQKSTARGHAMDARLDATIADSNARHDASNARLDATWAELIALRKDVK